ncbi:DUF2889 domain-containing protein [Paraburkholderia hospita]|uniref:DUF2889 domain-containing protein n=1 Tax=Paraburkholderia hospita TaxID=169430 RepID=UPI002ED6C1F0
MNDVLPPAQQNTKDEGRVPLHTRHVALHGYRRADCLYDIEGHLRDTESYDRASHGVFPKAGQPARAMRLRITLGLIFGFDSRPCVVARVATKRALALS